ncbi:MAG: NADH-quinone oxidoreductase subunit H, partial [Planctomycetales bacterium]|nr:NADH-quinone oxidoreductase subunit H [Planctomycetales bacterium]
MVHFIIQLVLVLLLPPLLLGIINKVKAWFGGRVGPPWLQVYYDLWKLAQKDTVFSRTTTWIFRFGPMVVLVT